MASKNKKERLILEKMSEFNKLFINIPENKKTLLEGLVKQAAWMFYTLLEMQETLLRDGVIEDFQNGKQCFQRESSLSKTYISMQKNYLATIKELMTYVPEEKATDELTEFLNKRK